MMKDHEIDTICALVLKLTGEQFEVGQSSVLIRALQAGVNAKAFLEQESMLEKELLDMHEEEEEEEMPEEPVIIPGPVSPKGFFKR